jgi:hypothetical protein
MRLSPTLLKLSSYTLLGVGDLIGRLYRQCPNIECLYPNACCQPVEFLSLWGLGYAIMQVIHMIQPKVWGLYPGFIQGLEYPLEP